MFRSLAKPTRLGLTRLVWTGAVFVSLLSSVPGSAQGRCEAVLEEAQRKYELGLFEDVPGLLEPCLTGENRRDEQVQAYSLLTRTYLAADEPEKAREAAAFLLRLDPTFQPEPSSPTGFQSLIEESRPKGVTQVASVSRTREALREAPATVIVMTREEIERRGYLDIEELLHDIPGFDISKSNGVIYSSFYQRGFRSESNDRILLLVDGVEQNDLSTNSVQLSRQYPLSDIDRVEIVYGPASTMYGYNAYTGVINIIMQEPETLITPGKGYAVSIHAGTGTFASRYLDLGLSGRVREGHVAWSLSGRFYRSNEWDTSRVAHWNDRIDYRKLLTLRGKDAAEFCQRYTCFSSTLYEVIPTDDLSSPYLIKPTDQAIDMARDFDRKIFDDFGGAFPDSTEDWSLLGKLKIANFTAGLQMWQIQEGIAPAYSGESLATRLRNSYAPRQASLYIRYSRLIGRDLHMKMSSQYRLSGLDSSKTFTSSFNTYGTGRLDLFDLVSGQPHDGATTHSFGRFSNQFKQELSLIYDPSERLNVVGGFEMRNGTIQGETDVFPGDFYGPHLEVTDLALYAQGSYRPLKTLKLVLGGRLDYNHNSRQSGFGTLFSSRAALVYTPPSLPFVVKLIFSEAYRQPTAFELLSNSGLQPELARNLEMSTLWEPFERLALELILYQTDYTNVIEQIEIDDEFGFRKDFRNAGEFRGRGLHLNARYTRGGGELFGNYTYTDPYDLRRHRTNPARLRIGDIARHRFNIGAHVDWTQKLGSGVRMGYVGDRETGLSTTVPSNPLHRIDSYTVVDATLTYKDILPGAKLQIIVNNLLNESYNHPGVRTADGHVFAPQIPQPGRTSFFRIIYSMPERQHKDQL